MATSSVDKSTVRTMRSKSVSQADDNVSKKQGKNDSRKNPVQVGLLCATCSIHVGDEDSLPCDFCGRYTHLSCDKAMHTDLYSALNKYQPNPLLYFCIECKPMLVPKQAKNLWAGFLDRVGKAVEGKKGDEPLAHKIMDKMSLKIEHLDDMLREHRASTDKVKEELEEMLQNHRNTMCDTRNALDTAVHRHSDSLMNSSAALVKTKAALGEISTQISDIIKSKPPNPQVPPNQPPHQSSQQNAPPLSTPVSFAQAAAFQPPPNFGYHANFRQHVFRGPPVHNRQTPPSQTPDPDTTLVLYNADHLNIRTTVEDLMIQCKIYKYEVNHANVLSKSSTDNRQSKPIFIICDQPRTKWNFIRDINKLRDKYPGYEGIYARPYLSGDDLRADRNLYRKLVDIRQRHSGRIFKIYKGEIYEKTEDSFDKYVEPMENINEDNSETDTPDLEAATETSDSTPVIGNGGA